MAQLKVPIDNFNLNAIWSCLFRYNSSSSTYNTWQTDPTVTKTVTFTYDLPKNSVIKGAKVHSVWSGSLYGIDDKTINGVEPDQDGFVTIDTAGATESSLSVEFLFRANRDVLSNNHDYDNLLDGGLEDHTYTLGTHKSSVLVSDVYLLIDYDAAIEFTGWTDDPLVVGETYVKAVHMIELQQWAALLSEYADNGTPTFTEAVPGETSLALWQSQVLEIRAVLDVVNPDHDPWIDVSVNCPRADVMTQLRDIIVAAM